MTLRQVKAPGRGLQGSSKDGSLFPLSLVQGCWPLGCEHLAKVRLTPLCLPVDDKASPRAPGLWSPRVPPAWGEETWQRLAGQEPDLLGLVPKTPRRTRQRQTLCLPEPLSQLRADWSQQLRYENNQNTCAI